jgi:hypothetical protein
VGYVAEIVR